MGSSPTPGTLQKNAWHNRAAAFDSAIRKRDVGGSVFMPLLSGFSGEKTV